MAALPRSWSGVSPSTSEALALLSRMLVSASCTTTPACRFSMRLRCRASLDRSASSIAFWAWTSVMVPARRSARPSASRATTFPRLRTHRQEPSAWQGAEFPVEAILAGGQDRLVDGAELGQVVWVHAAGPLVGADPGVHRGAAGDLVHPGAVEDPPGHEVPLPVAVGAGVEDLIAGAPGSRAPRGLRPGPPSPRGTGDGGCAGAARRRTRPARLVARSALPSRRARRQAGRIPERDDPGDGWRRWRSPAARAWRTNRFGRSVQAATTSRRSVTTARK